MFITIHPLKWCLRSTLRKNCWRIYCHYTYRKNLLQIFVCHLLMSDLDYIPSLIIFLLLDVSDDKGLLTFKSMLLVIFIYVHLESGKWAETFKNVKPKEYELKEECNTGTVKASYVKMLSDTCSSKEITARHVQLQLFVFGIEVSTFSLTSDMDLKWKIVQI